MQWEPKDSIEPCKMINIYKKYKTLFFQNVFKAKI